MTLFLYSKYVLNFNGQLSSSNWDGCTLVMPKRLSFLVGMILIKKEIRLFVFFEDIFYN